MGSKKPFVKKNTLVLIGILTAGLLGAFIFSSTYKPGKIIDYGPVNIIQSTKAPLADTKNIQTYTLNQVKTHADEASCWSVVRGNVYDLTSAINTHKSGPEDILEMCGKDATDAYVKKHGGQSKAENWLESLKIGTLQK